MTDNEYAGSQAYSVGFCLLNSCNFGLPQNRARVYIVVVRLCGRHGQDVTMPWPREGLRPLKSQPSLEAIFDEGPTLATYSNYPMPATNSRTNVRNITAALTAVNAKAQRLHVNPATIPVIVDVGSSKPHWTIGKCQCVTSSRAASHGLWSLQHGRPLTASELMRLQGFNPDQVRIDGIFKPQLCHALGNSFSVPVFGRVLQQALKIV